MVAVGEMVEKVEEAAVVMREVGEKADKDEAEVEDELRIGQQHRQQLQHLQQAHIRLRHLQHLTKIIRKITWKSWAQFPEVSRQCTDNWFRKLLEQRLDGEGD